MLSLLSLSLTHTHLIHLMSVEYNIRGQGLIDQI